MRYLFTLVMVLALASCSDGRGSAGKLNPFNWFKGTGAQNQNAVRTLAPSRGYGIAVDTRPMVDQITALNIERTPTGAIIRATALTPTEGYHSAELVFVPSGAIGSITLQFRAQPPARAYRTGPEHLRELVAGFSVSRAQLRGIRQISVVGARNSRSIRP